jgi:hypothetical protein
MGMIRRDPRSAETRDENGTAGSSSKFIHPLFSGENGIFHCVPMRMGMSGGLGVGKIMELVVAESTW